MIVRGDCMLIGGLDVGTTGCKLTIYNHNGEFIHNEYIEYEVKRQNGEHEIDAGAIFEAVCSVIQKSCKKYSGISAIGITTFGETFVALDSNDNILAAAKALKERSEAKYIVLKLGERGCALFDGESLKTFPSYETNVVDTTAAGDCFTAALALEYIKSGDIEKACDFGNKAGAFAVSKMGAENSMPAIEDILKI